MRRLNLLLSLCLLFGGIRSAVAGDDIFSRYKAKMDSVSDSFGHTITVEMPVWAEFYDICGVSPNPACSTLVFFKKTADGASVANACTAGEENAEALLYDGQSLVRRMPLNFSNGQNQMSVSDLPNGLYYLNIVENGAVVGRHTVVVQH